MNARLKGGTTGFVGSSGTHWQLQTPKERERDGLCGASVSTLTAQFSEEFSMQNAEKLRRTLGRNCSDLD